MGEKITIADLNGNGDALKEASTRPVEEGRPLDNGASEKLSEFELPEEIKSAYLDRVKNRGKGEINLKRWLKEAEEMVVKKEKELSQTLTDQESSDLVVDFLEKKSPIMKNVIEKMSTIEVVEADSGAPETTPSLPLPKKEKISPEDDGQETVCLSAGEFRKKFGKFCGKNFFRGEGEDRNWKYVSSREYDPKAGMVVVWYGFSHDNKKKQKTISYDELEKELEGYAPELGARKMKIEKGKKKGAEKIKKWNANIENTDDYTPTQMAALHTMSKLKDVSELHAETEEKGNEVFAQKTRELWKEFQVHGRVSYDKNGKVIFKAETDLDGQGALKLLKLAGIDVSDVKYENHEEYRKGGLTLDASGRHGVVTPDQGESTIIDHHAKESRRDSSTTKFTYEMLIELGLLKEDEELKKFVELVTDDDNERYSDEEVEELFNPKTKKFSKTLIGLSKYLTADQVFDLLKDDENYKKPLSADILKKVKGCDPLTKDEKTLEEFSLEVKKRIENSEKAIERMKEAGFEIDSGEENFGKILIDTGRIKIVGRGDREGYSNKVSEGFLPVRAAGYGANIIWVPEQDRFKIFTKKPLDGIEFSQGFNVRGSFWNKPGNDKEKLVVTLEEILSKLCGKPVKIDGKLQAAMEEEKKQRAAALEEIEKNKQLMADFENKIDPAQFDEKIYGKVSAEKAKELANQLKAILAGEIGKGKKFPDWNKKKSSLIGEKGIGKKIDIFLAKMEKIKAEKEKEVSPEKKELSETEKAYVEAYVEFAKDYIEEAREYYSEGNGFSPASISAMLKGEEEKFWNHEFLAIVIENQRIREENVPLVIEEVKKQIQ